MTGPDVSEEYQQEQQKNCEEHEGEHIEILTTVDDARPQEYQSKTGEEEYPGNNSCCPKLQDRDLYFRNRGR